MIFEPKMSGTKVSDYNIELIVKDGFVSLRDLIDKQLSQKTMDYLLDYFRFIKSDNDWVALIDVDTSYKISVLENYPNYEKEFKEYFGENWLHHYIRFNH